MRRFRAITFALWYGILPSCLYEEKRHYSCSYLQHLWINICYAIRWATFRENDADKDFVQKTNYHDGRN